jgi:hypothetical protein
LNSINDFIENNVGLQVSEGTIIPYAAPHDHLCLRVFTAYTVLVTNDQWIAWAAACLHSQEPLKALCQLLSYIVAVELQYGIMAYYTRYNALGIGVVELG